MEIRDYEREKQPLFGLDMSIGAAVGAYCKARWPTHTAKNAAREWGEDRRKGIEGLSLDEARGVVSGKPSMRSFNTIWRHPNGGLRFVVAIAQAVTNETITDIINQELEAIADERARIEDQESLLRQRYAAVRARRAVDGGSLVLVHPEDADAARTSRRRRGGLAS